MIVPAPILPQPIVGDDRSGRRRLSGLTKNWDRGAEDEGEQICQSGVIDSGDLVEDARLVHSALGNQEMEVRVEIDPGSECP